MTTLEVQALLHDDPQFVYLKRFDHDISKLLARYPDGCPDHVVAAALMITEEDVQAQYAGVVAKLRVLMGVPVPP